MKSTRRQRARVAHHEAGHAVIARTFGRAVHRISLQLGHVVFLLPRPVFRDLNRGRAPWWRLQQEIMISLAGPAAEALFTGRPDHGGGLDDFVRAHELGSHATLGNEETEALVEWLYIRTHTMLELPMCWAQVERVAAALLRDEVLNGAAVDAVMSGGRRSTRQATDGGRSRESR